MDSDDPLYIIWVNYNISLYFTNLNLAAIWAWFPLLTINFPGLSWEQVTGRARLIWELLQGFGKFQGWGRKACEEDIAMV